MKLIKKRYKRMQYKFSEELRKKLVEYFKRNHKLDITNEMADEWLDSMADLFLVFSEINTDKQSLH